MSHGYWIVGSGIHEKHESNGAIFPGEKEGAGEVPRVYVSLGGGVS